LEQPWDGRLAGPRVMRPGWPKPGGRDVRAHGTATVGAVRTPLAVLCGALLSLLAAGGVLRGLLCPLRCRGGGRGPLAHPAAVLVPRCRRGPRGLGGSRRPTGSRGTLARRSGRNPLAGQRKRLLHVPGSRRRDSGWLKFELPGRGGGRPRWPGGRARTPVGGGTT